MASKPPFAFIASTGDCFGETCKSSRNVEQILEKATGQSLRKFDLGPMPSPNEVDAAVASFQSFLQENLSSESMSKWLQPILDCYDSTSRILRCDANRWVCKILQWLQTDHSFKRLVVSLCLDKAVWDAIVNNETLRKLQELHSSGGNGKPESFKEGPDWVSIILRWIFDMALTKMAELVESFLILLNGTFRSLGREKLASEDRDRMEEKAQASMVLSLVIMLIVAVARAQIA